MRRLHPRAPIAYRYLLHCAEVETAAGRAIGRFPADVWMTQLFACNTIQRVAAVRWFHRSIIAGIVVIIVIVVIVVIVKQMPVPILRLKAIIVIIDKQLAASAPRRLKHNIVIRI